MYIVCHYNNFEFGRKVMKFINHKYMTTHKYMIVHLMTLNNMPVEILDMMKALKIKESSKIQTARH